MDRSLEARLDRALRRADRGKVPTVAPCAPTVAPCGVCALNPILCAAHAPKAGEP